MKLQEEFSAKIPALVLLSHLGWQFLSPDQALAERGGKINEVVLRSVLRKELQKRRFLFAGKEHALSSKGLDSIINELCSPALNEGLHVANEKIYNHLLLGISVTEFIDGKKANPTIPIVDWNNIKNNSFLFTEEFNILRTNGYGQRRPDIVCFVNGLPVVVIEAKRPDGHAQFEPTIAEGISQNIRNQRHDEIPHLFAYTQLLLSINGMEGRYGTQGTDSKFWAAWREEDLTDSEIYSIKNKKLNAEQKAEIFHYRNENVQQWYEQLIKTGGLAVTDQDRILISLLSHDRLMEFIRLFVLHDSKAGKIVARYQQVFGIKRLIERINKKRPDGGRQGGVIWHTTGSGKSFTMVYLSKALILNESLKQCRLIVVTDRTDLERQLSKTFSSGGEIASKKDREAAMATSGKRLAEQIGRGNERIIFSLIQKFNTAATLPECRNSSSDIIILIDEGHRSQGGENNARMQQALPNAAFVAFTGTPLLKEDKTTNKFGPIVHAYTMQRAVEDKAVTPLLYEERLPELSVNEKAIDLWFERITKGLTEEQKSDLKKKFAKKDQVIQSEDRIRLIALDIANHFNENIVEGLKGQIACESRESAILYKKYLDEVGLFESAVVMSPPDTREGNTKNDEKNIPLLHKWWKENVGSKDEQVYTQEIKDRFEKDDKLKIIIVVDKLLTGFDEPKNTVLYIDKSLKEHNLIQAIARVNRLHPKKKFGLLIDYRGILKELDTTIAKYQDLANRSQGGFDISDIEGLYNQMSSEYKRLPHLHDNLWAIFKNVKNKLDFEQLRQVLIPKLTEMPPKPGELRGEMVDVNQKTRDDFFETLTEFANCLKVATQSATYYQDTSFSENDRQTYKETFKQFNNLRSLVKKDAGQTIDFDEYTDQVKKLMDKHVVGVQIKTTNSVYEVKKMGYGEGPESWNKDKTRNETDLIKTRVAKSIEQDLRKDPYAQEAFSVLLRQVIEEVESLFDHPLKQYMLYKEFEEKVEKRELDDIPERVKGNRQVQAYYGIFKKTMPEAFTRMATDQQENWINLAFTIDQTVDKSLAENSINPHNIESDIRKNLLPLVFKECKEIGGGMDVAKAIIELVVQITRVGFNGK